MVGFAVWVYGVGPGTDMGSRRVAVRTFSSCPLEREIEWCKFCWGPRRQGNNNLRPIHWLVITHNSPGDVGWIRATSGENAPGTKL